MSEYEQPLSPAHCQPPAHARRRQHALRPGETGRQEKEEAMDHASDDEEQEDNVEFQHNEGRSQRRVSFVDLDSDAGPPSPRHAPKSVPQATQPKPTKNRLPVAPPPIQARPAKQAVPQPTQPSRPAAAVRPTPDLSSKPKDGVSVQLKVAAPQRIKPGAKPQVQTARPAPAPKVSVNPVSVEETDSSSDDGEEEEDIMSFLEHDTQTLAGVQEAFSEWCEMLSEELVAFKPLRAGEKVRRATTDGQRFAGLTRHIFRGMLGLVQTRVGLPTEAIIGSVAMGDRRSRGEYRKTHARRFLENDIPSELDRSIRCLSELKRDQSSDYGATLTTSLVPAAR